MTPMRLLLATTACALASAAPCKVTEYNDTHYGKIGFKDLKVRCLRALARACC